MFFGSRGYTPSGSVPSMAYYYFVDVFVSFPLFVDSLALKGRLGVFLYCVGICT